jgi:predicted Rossmann fold nucleotide-binding protein DprA/Smf involved in DNA uptake
VLVAQAPQKSGALITVEHALQEGRDVAVCAFGMTGERGAGCERLASEGAPVVSEYCHIAALLGMGIGMRFEGMRPGIGSRAAVAAKAREERALF